MQTLYDYIIVGAGSAGCVLAERLSRDASHRVLLIEAGGPDRNPLIHIPLGAAALQRSKLDWCYETEPEAELNNRRIKWPRGKVLGGSSSLNGMIYIRGQRQDFDGWAAAGNNGWSYKELLPYFLRHEHHAGGETLYHGIGGPLWVDKVAGQFGMAEQFVEAGQEIGLPFNPDFNGEQQEGIGYFDVNIKNGVRQSSATAYLKPIQKRPNLVIEIWAHVARILIEDGRAVGVAFERGGQIREARCSGEVVLSGGTVNSPQLLELSGIGDETRLRACGVQVHKHLPGVGENLQDHLTVNVCYNVKTQTTYFDEMRPWRFLRHVLSYAFKRCGLLALPSAQVGAFFRTDSTADRPDAQIHFAPAAGRYNDKGVMVPEPGSTATVCYLRPSSRGSVHIQSNRPGDYPSIRANYLTTEDDRRALIEAVKKTRSIFGAECLQVYGGCEMTPGVDVQTDDEILDYVRRDAVSVYHPTSSCRMGVDAQAVVDPSLRVYGVEALRVADASIMPSIISGNTHATCVVIADKCADMILMDRYRPNRSRSEFEA